ncbi:hypothetical protein [Novipirellula artificiosorum]|uniref:Uncharacterized protein n=1 Tax=Novipirellula artificiosorum TaxID=2528016 RepID=A0A5C6DN28_9BACT|nr:hypothetical protein [Novipirellula artificiosorum]TWU37061.1 hypothetical protein Poly41_31870 [Novipirellula artificiosorum]
MISSNHVADADSIEVGPNRDSHLETPHYYPHSIRLIPDATIKDTLQQEVEHLDRRLHRVLDRADGPALILDAVVVEPELLKQAVLHFPKARPGLSCRNLIMIVRESQLQDPRWPAYRKWFRHQLDAQGSEGQIACLVLQEDCPETAALAVWIARTQSFIVTDSRGICELAAAPVEAWPQSSCSEESWLQQLFWLAKFDMLSANG